MGPQGRVGLQGFAWVVLVVVAGMRGPSRPPWLPGTPEK